MAICGFGAFFLRQDDTHRIPQNLMLGDGNPLLLFDPLAEIPEDLKSPTCNMEVVMSPTPYVRSSKSFSFHVTSSPRAAGPQSEKCVHKGRFWITRTAHQGQVTCSSPSDEEVRGVRCEIGITERKQKEFDELIDIF